MPDARYVYVGEEGEAYFGIPARDLTDDEFAALDPEQQATVKKSRIYQYQSPPKATAAKADAPKDASGQAKA